MRSPWYAGVTLVAGLLATAACDDSPSGPGTGEPVEGVRFNYSGSHSGTFQSSGTPTLDTDGSVNYGLWTAAQRDSLGGIVIASFRPDEGSSTDGDLFILQLGPAEVRNWPCATSVPNGPRCFARLLVGLGAETFSTAEYYEAVSGTASIAEMSATRVKGTFSLVTRSNGGSGPFTITLSDGQFDAPILGGSTGNAVRCVVERATTGQSQPCAEGWDP